MGLENNERFEPDDGKIDDVVGKLGPTVDGP